MLKRRYPHNTKGDEGEGGIWGAEGELFYLQTQKVYECKFLLQPPQKGR